MFKACLFLGSGSVIHAMHHAQELEDMGGLRKKMPITFWTFVISTLALAGMPLTSGFLSKDAILFTALHERTVCALRHRLYGAAFLTAFYMTRLVWLCFMGKPKNQEKYDHAHESPWPMTHPADRPRGAVVRIRASRPDISRRSSSARRLLWSRSRTR